VVQEVVEKSKPTQKNVLFAVIHTTKALVKRYHVVVDIPLVRIVFELIYWELPTIHIA